MIFFLPSQRARVYAQCNLRPDQHVSVEACLCCTPLRKGVGLGFWGKYVQGLWLRISDLTLRGCCAQASAAEPRARQRRGLHAKRWGRVAIAGAQPQQLLQHRYLLVAVQTQVRLGRALHVLSCDCAHTSSSQDPFAHI